MKKIAVLFVVLLGLTSCNEAYRALGTARRSSSMLAGRTLSYTGDYEFSMDSIQVEDPFKAIELYMNDKNWMISRESDEFLNFEYSTTELSRQTTGKIANGQANFSKTSDEEFIELTLRLRGNYQFGTKTKALKYYNELRGVLYNINLETESNKKRNKKKKSDN